MKQNIEKTKQTAVNKNIILLQNIGGLKPKLIMTSTVDHFIYSMYRITHKKIYN